VTEHRVRLYKTSDGKIISAIRPPTIRKTGLFSLDMIARVGYFKGRCHASTSTLRAIFADVVGSDETGHPNPAFKSAWT
jgi:hypothetical protein